MQYITYHFAPLNRPLNGRYIHATGLHGLLFNITGQADRKESDWLHKPPKRTPDGKQPPRPFAMVPLYTDEGHLAGIRLSALTDRVRSLFERTGEWFCRTERPCHLGGQEFIISDSRSTPGPNWRQLALTEPSKQVGFRFVSPTAFKQGPGRLPLPLPGNVFSSPQRVWEAFAPSEMKITDTWLDWCKRDLFITHHNIETVQVNINNKEKFTGFVGEVWYEAYKGSDSDLRTLQAMAELATFSGIGNKTTMGMGAVERI